VNPDGILASVVESGAKLAGSPGVTGRVGLVVTGTADGDIKVRVRLVDGRPVEAVPAGGGDPELTLTVTSGDAAAMARGEMAPSVAFMRGRLKTAGDNGLLLRLLAATNRPDFGPWLGGLTTDRPQ
jgi:hypothetical protein